MKTQILFLLMLSCHLCFSQTAGETNSNSAGNIGNALGRLGATMQRNRIEKSLREPKGLLFDNWKGAKKFGQWNWLETPKDDINVYRYFEKGIFNFTNKSENFTWTTNQMQGIKPAGYLYEVTFQASNVDYVNGEYGILVETKESDGSFSKICFFIHPVDATVYIGVWSHKTESWTRISNTADGSGYKFSAIKPFDSEGKSINVLKIKKMQDDMMFFINGSVVMHFYLKDNFEGLNNFNGIGIISNRKVSASVPSISFEAW